MSRLDYGVSIPRVSSMSGPVALEYLMLMLQNV